MSVVQAEQQVEQRRPLPKYLEFIRENIECLVVAILMALIIRHFIFEPFQIPTGSMATTLMGKHRMLTCEHCQWDWPVSDKVMSSSMRCPQCLQLNERTNSHVWSGEKILANKMVYYFREPKRWETIVFKPPHQKHLNFIKRVIAFGGEKLTVQGGDVYINDKISVKPPHIQKEVWIPTYDMAHDIEKTQFFDLTNGWQRDVGDNGFTQAYHYQNPQDRLTNTMSWDRRIGGNVGDEFIWSALSYNKSDSFLHLHPVGDLKIDLDVEIKDPKGLFVIDIEDGKQKFRLELSRQSKVVHYIGLKVVNTYPLDIKKTFEEKTKISFSNWDNHLLVVIDEQVVLDQQVDVDVLSTLEGHGTFRLAARDSDVTLTNIKVFRDIYYTSGGSQKSWIIPQNELFAMGDNSNGSRDSRDWGTVPRKNLRGRPWLRLLHIDFPFTRTKFDWVRFGDVP